jgi:hypothetical protein
MNELRVDESTREEDVNQVARRELDRLPQSPGLRSFRHDKLLKEQIQLAIFSVSEPALSAAEECLCGGGLKTTA